MSTKHKRAKEEFWEVINAKCVGPGPIEREMLDTRKLCSAVDYMLDKLPTWAVDKATGWMKDWTP